MIEKIVIFYNNTNRLDLWEKSYISRSLDCIEKEIHSDNTIGFIEASLICINDSTKIESERSDAFIEKEYDKVNIKKL